jgi:hypothetical protein
MSLPTMLVRRVNLVLLEIDKRSSIDTNHIGWSAKSCMQAIRIGERPERMRESKKLYTQRF